MPELPEVETVVKTLEDQLKYPTIIKCQVFWDKIIACPDVQMFCEGLRAKKIIAYRRLGKYLLFDLKDYMWIAHMRMEGKFYVEQRKTPYDKHTHVIIHLQDGRELRYHDTRKFGKMYLYKKLKEDRNYPCFLKIGYDVFDQRLQANDLYNRLHSRKKAVLKAVLLDQSVMAGIGNIYADEICFAMGMHPETKIARLRKKEFEQLLDQSRRILSGAIQSGGTTIRSYTSSLKVDGRFQLKLKVYAKKGEACGVCGTRIEKIVVATRGTCFCPHCQKKR